jgi:hypothetical protein
VTHPIASLRRDAALSATTLLSSAATLVCCVLPAVLVGLGAGATLAGLVTAVPQLIWLSAHKALVFGSAGALLIVSGLSLWHARRLPCPTDPNLARSCQSLRRLSVVLYAAASITFLLGAAFAFGLPLLS